MSFEEEESIERRSGSKMNLKKREGEKERGNVGGGEKEEEM